MSTELREIESETQEQSDTSTDMALEIEEHQEQMETLEQAVSALKEAQASVDSEGLRESLLQAEEARKATEERLEDLRAQRDEMLERNEAMLDQCQRASERKRQALEKVPNLRAGMKSSSPEADVSSDFYAKMETALQEDMDRTSLAEVALQNVRQRLESLDI